MLLGCGSGGMPLLETLASAGESVVVIDDDPELIGRLREGEVASVHGDASDRDVLRSDAVERAKLVCSTIRRPRNNQRILELVRQIPVLARVFDDADAAWVEARGGTAAVQSELAAEEFCRWLRSWSAKGQTRLPSTRDSRDVSGGAAGLRLRLPTAAP